MTLVEHVGGWDTGPGAIGEDMHMYLKCFFALGGNLKVQIVYSAASQCNVSSDVKGLSGYFDGLRARYRQALRHMWGALDTGYAIRESVKMVSRHKVANAPPAELPLSASKSVFNLIQRYGASALTYCSANWSAFYTSTGLHKSLIPRRAETEHAPPKTINKTNLFTLYHRLFEAHFLPCHLAVRNASLALRCRSSQSRHTADRRFARERQGYESSAVMSWPQTKPAGPYRSARSSDC